MTCERVLDHGNTQHLPVFDTLPDEFKDVLACWVGCHLKASFREPTFSIKGIRMKLKTLKNIQIVAVVAASMLLMACNSKTTAPQSLLANSANSNYSDASRAKDIPNLVDHYGVTPAQSVVFSKNSDESIKDFSY